MLRTFCCVAGLLMGSTCLGADWLQFRGPNGASASGDKAPPATFDTTNNNVAWKAELTGRAASSPIVVSGRVIVTSSSGVKQDRLHVVCFAEDTGKKLWERQFWATGRTLTHPFSAVAAPTPASDGERIFAFYSSNDLACLDLEGNLLWYRGLAYDYPQVGNDIGMASSPVVVGDTVVVQVENQGDSFAAGIDTNTGETRWRVDRDRRANWVSPVALPGKRSGRDVVLLQSGTGFSGHDAQTGEQLWKFDLPCSTTPSPAVTADRIYIPANGLTAFDIPADASTPALAWSSNVLSPSPASPVVGNDGKIYTMNNSGVLTCGDAKTGERLWQLRVGGRHWATPVLAGDRLYTFDDNGVAKVVAIGEKGEIVNTTEFGSPVKGSPALANGALFVRTDSHLWKIAAP